MSIQTLIQNETQSNTVDSTTLDDIHHAEDIYDEMNRRIDKEINPKVWDNNIINLFNITTKTIDFREHIDYSWNEFIRRIDRRDIRDISIEDQIPKGKSWQCFSTDCTWSNTFEKERKIRECPECGHSRPYKID